tara:strand:- start:886 stop:1524 length:639 start_codon:yes stop_codon:yes gene_type:complete
MRAEHMAIFNRFSFSSVPFIGLGNANRVKLLQHPYLQNVEEGVHKTITPWTGTSSTVVGITSNGVTFAALSLDGNVDYVNKPKVEAFKCVLTPSHNQYYDVDIYSTDDYHLPKEYAVEAFPKIFSAIPLDVSYSILIDQLITNVPNTGGGGLMMQGNSSRLMNGQIFVPAGEIVDLGPILKMIRRKESTTYPKDNHLITRHVHLGIRKRLYG